MKVLVLGAAGYVGSVLCYKLKEEGHEVVAIDSGFFGFDSLDESCFTVLKKDGFNLDENDLEDCECFINLSGLSNDPMADFSPELNFKLNTDLTEYTAKLCKKSGVGKYILASSCSIYDFGTSDEQKDVLVNEEVPVDPERYYSLSKYRAERKVLALNDDNFKTIVLRKATICGYSPKMRYDLVVNCFVKDAMKSGFINLHGGGENWRPLIDVNDICEIYCRLVGYDGSGLFNAVGYNIRISELGLRVMNTIKDYDNKFDIDIKCDYTTPKSSIRNYRVSGKKLHEALGYVPPTPVSESVNGILNKLESINDFDNPIYYNIAWFKKYLQHWIK